MAVVVPYTSTSSCAIQNLIIQSINGNTGSSSGVVEIVLALSGKCWGLEREYEQRPVGFGRATASERVTKKLENVEMSKPNSCTEYAKNKK